MGMRHKQPARVQWSHDLVRVRHIICLIATFTMFGAIPSANAGYLRELCPSGASYPIGASNNDGDLLVAWEQTELPVRDGICEQTASRAAIVSSNDGVIPLGTVPSGGALSFPVGAYIDGAGDAWIVGLHGEVGYGKYGASYSRQGPWLSFLPVGGVFRGPVELPSRHGRSESVVIAGNLAGSCPNCLGCFAGYLHRMGRRRYAISHKVCR